VLRRFRVPEIVLGALLLVAIFAMGAAVQIINPENQSQHRQRTNDAPKDSSGDRGISSDERIAKYTEELAWATVVLALSTLGVLIVTWRAGVRQSGDMKAALDHAERALATAERAFVFLDGFDIQLTTAVDNPNQGFDWLPPRYQQDPGAFITRFALQPRWKNGGNTPTEALTIQVDWNGPRGHEAPDYGYREPARPFFLAPRAIEPGPVIEVPPARALVDWIMNPVGERPIILFWGRADYRDVFGNPHFVESCYELLFIRPVPRERMAARFVQWGNYNRTDSGKENQGD
jgi:hypothetical protein